MEEKQKSFVIGINNICKYFNLEGGKMEKTKTCLDCLHCKLINRRKNLTCKAGEWQKNNGESKFIKLIPYEIKTLDIRSRDIFQSAARCDQMINID